MSKVVFLTGGTSGIGRATALLLQEKGCTVYEMSRRADGDPALTHLVGDITDPASIRACVEQVMEREGRIDILVNNAGFGISGAIEFTTKEEAEKQLAVNFFGAVNVCREVLPIMRKQGSGRIVNLSSVAAPIAIPFQAFYSASKAAINAYTQALANEVRPYGVSVCAVMPGDIHTGFTAAREKQIRGDEEYQGRISRSVGRMEHDEQTGMAPEQAAAKIAKVALARRVKPLYAIRFDYQLFVVLSRILPVRLLNWLVYQLYAK